MTGTQWFTEEEKIQQDFLWALGPEVTHQITRSDQRIALDTFWIRQIIQILQQILFTQKKQINSGGGFFPAEQTYTETPENHWEKLVKLEK